MPTWPILLSLSPLHLFLLPCLPCLFAFLFYLAYFTYLAFLAYVVYQCLSCLPCPICLPNLPCHLVFLALLAYLVYLGNLPPLAYTKSSMFTLVTLSRTFLVDKPMSLLLLLVGPACPKGKYGSDCSLSCPEFCRDGLCDIDAGFCLACQGNRQLPFCPGNSMRNVFFTCNFPTVVSFTCNFPTVFS